MVGNRHDFAIIYSEDVLDKGKGCEFHFKESVKSEVTSLGPKGGSHFKRFSYVLLNSATAEAYLHALSEVKSFALQLSELPDWIDW